MIKMIIASTKSGVIGLNNSLPWHIKEELQFFKNKTIDTTLIMGYNTYNSLPKFLPNRDIIVLTRREIKNVKTIKLDKISELFNSFRNSEKILFISGGKMLYEQFYKEAEIIYHSIIKKNYPGDTYVNINYGENYNLQKIETHEKFIVKIWNKNK